MGLTVIVNVVGSPTQVIPPLVKFGVTVIMDVTATDERLLAEKAGMLPVPVAARPIEVFELVQL